MIEQDTVKLLRECDAGVKMCIDSIEDEVDRVKDKELRGILVKGRQDHQELKTEIQQLLCRYRDEGKDPGMIAKSMSHRKTGMKMGLDESDSTVADLMTDGCNMGVKSLSRYRNQYAAADEKSKDICKKLIRLEEQLAIDMRDYL